MLKTFDDEYIQTLRDFPMAHVVMLIDFDDRVEERTARFEESIPVDIKARVFVVGSKSTPEILKNSLKLGFEKLGESLADDCDAGTALFWGHEQLKHNHAERQLGSDRQALSLLTRLQQRSATPSRPPAAPEPLDNSPRWCILNASAFCRCTCAGRRRARIAAGSDRLAAHRVPARLRRAGRRLG